MSDAEQGKKIDISPFLRNARHIDGSVERGSTSVEIETTGSLIRPISNIGGGLGSRAHAVEESVKYREATAQAERRPKRTLFGRMIVDVKKINNG